MIRLPIWTLQLAGLILSAAATLAVLWLALSLLLSLHGYIPTEVLR